MTPTQAQIDAALKAVFKDDAKHMPIWRELMIAALTAAAEVGGKLPEGMEHCTILFKECEKGHGWLTATNWVQHGCPTCEIAATIERCAQVVENWYITHSSDAPSEKEIAAAIRALKDKP